MTTELDLINRHPAAHRNDLPRIKHEWQGRRIAVRYIKRRGTYHSRTSMGWAWGVLVEAAEDRHVTVREREGRVRNIHYTRITAVYDLTRTKEQT